MKAYSWSFLLLISHQGEHRLEPGASGHPWGQLPHWPLLQGTRQCFWSGDHPCVAQDACPQEKPQLLPHSQLLSRVWTHHHSLFMCYLQAQLNKTDCSDVSIRHWWTWTTCVCSEDEVKMLVLVTVFQQLLKLSLCHTEYMWLKIFYIKWYH